MNKWDKRDRKRSKRNKMRVESRSVFTIQREIGKRAKRLQSESDKTVRQNNSRVALFPYV